MTDAPQQLEQPQGVKPIEADEVIVHAMPVEFRGGKSPMTTLTPAATPAAIPPKVIAPTTIKALVKPKRLVSPVLLVAGGLFFLAVVGLGLYALFSVRPAQQITTTNSAASQAESKVVPTESTVKRPAVTAPSVPAPGTDQDSDGLTNTEEILFGSDPRNPDTDGDTYLDGNEVYHLYNPRGGAQALLVDAGFAREFSAKEFSYTAIYPSRWTATTGDAPSQEMIFRVPTGEQVRIYVTTKDQITGFDTLEQATTKKGYAARLSKDKLTTYIESGRGTALYVVTYELKDVLIINFLTTYQMMVNSLTIL